MSLLLLGRYHHHLPNQHCFNKSLFSFSKSHLYIFHHLHFSTLPIVAFTSNLLSLFLLVSRFPFTCILFLYFSLRFTFQWVLVLYTCCIQLKFLMFLAWHCCCLWGECLSSKVKSMKILRVQLVSFYGESEENNLLMNE